MVNIFDIKNLENIPKDVRGGLKRDPFGDEIIQLFRMADGPLTVDQVYIAYYRLFSASMKEGEYKTKPGAKLKSKRQIMLKLYNMSKLENPQITSVDRAIYKLAERNLFSS
ncbi:MAG: hypothetical protein FWE50_03125 [Alphaproteobacteria bacterium]|nr:hypothetical protein [Alphaproteobacteria bacterium]